MPDKVLVNGVHSGSVSVADRGLHYGDGLFETLAVKAGQVVCVERHLDRLLRGCKRLAIPLPDKALLHQELGEIARGYQDLGVAKLVLTRGEGSRGYGPPENPKPTRIVLGYPWSGYPALHWREGVAVKVCNTRLSRNAALAGLKHLNRLEQVLARSELKESDMAEGLMLDTEGWVVEGTMSNVFAVRKDELLTPDLAQCGVDGIVRGLIIDLARTRNDMKLRVESMGLETLLGADEAFLCNSLIGIWPLNRVGERTFSVGPVSQYYQKALLEQGSIVRKQDSLVI